MNLKLGEQDLTFACIFLLGLLILLPKNTIWQKRAVELVGDLGLTFSFHKQMGQLTCPTSIIGRSSFAVQNGACFGNLC